MEQLKACGLKTVSEQLKLRKLITLTLEQPTKAAACDNSPAPEGFGGARKKLSLVELMKICICICSLSRGRFKYQVM